MLDGSVGAGKTTLMLEHLPVISGTAGNRQYAMMHHLHTAKMCLYALHGHHCVDLQVQMDDDTLSLAYFLMSAATIVEIRKI